MRIASLHNTHACTRVSYRIVECLVASVQRHDGPEFQLQLLAMAARNLDRVALDAVGAHLQCMHIGGVIMHAHR